jgi:outer membrane lipase/esterase
MKRFLSGAVLVLFVFFPLAAIGSTLFANIVAVGDSLTDNGSFPLGTNPDSTDLHGIKYHTDGAVWVETLAGSMGSILYDVAYGGATTGDDNPAAEAAGLGFTGLQWQVENAIPAGINGDDTLFTVWAGANDFFQGRGFSDAATNIGAAMDKLKSSGATRILVPNLPDLGLTPGFYDDANPLVPTAVATGWSQAFNQQLFGELQTFAGGNPSVDVYFLDVYRIFSDIILMDNGEINPVYWSLMFWDEVHPTSFGHAIVAGEAYNVLQAGPMAVPVPAAIWLLGSGLLGLVVFKQGSKK